MLGKTHSIMGGAAGVIASQALGVSDPIVIATCGCVGAGAGCIPDFDTRSKQVNIMGDLGVGINFILSRLSDIAFETTRTPYDRPVTSFGAHRTLTHTLVFCALVVGGLWWAMTTTIGLGIVVGVLTFFFLVSGLFPGLSRQLTIPLVAWLFMGLCIGGGIWFVSSVGGSWRSILTVAIASGLASHLLGDIITKSGVALLWPLKIGGKRWRTFRVIGVDSSSFIANTMVGALSVVAAVASVLL